MRRFVVGSIVAAVFTGLLPVSARAQTSPVFARCVVVATAGQTRSCSYKAFAPKATYYEPRPGVGILRSQVVVRNAESWRIRFTALDTGFPQEYRCTRRACGTGLFDFYFEHGTKVTLTVTGGLAVVNEPAVLPCRVC